MINMDNYIRSFMW